MSRPLLWLRRSLARRGLLAATAATAFVITFLFVLIAGFALQSQRPAVRETIAAGPISTVGVRAETALAANPAVQDAAARRTIATRFPFDVHVYRSVVTAPLALAANAAAVAGLPSATVMESSAAVGSRIRIITGSWPAPKHVVGAHTHDAYPVAVQADAAKLLGLSVGDSVGIPSPDGALQLRVAATWKPKAASDPLWFGDRQVATGRAGDAVGPLIIDSDGLARLDATPSVRWVVAPDAATLTPAQLPALAHGYATLGRSLSARDDVSSAIVTVTGDGARTARGMQQSLASLGAVLSLPTVLLAVGGVLALILLARLLAETRSAETTLLRARGATSASLLCVAAFEAAAVGVAGAAVGVVGAAILLGGATGGLPPVAVLVAPPVLVIACVVAVLTAVTAGGVRGRPGATADSGRVRSAASLGLTVLVVAAAAFSLWRFLGYGSTGGAVDPIGVAAPALAILAAVMLGLRAFGPIASLFERVGARSPGVGLALPARQVGRGLGFFVAPAALIILAVGGTTLGAGYIGTWSAYRGTASHVANAGDIRVDTGEASPVTAPVDTAGGAAYESLPGVAAAIPAVRSSAQLGSGAVPVVAAPVDGLAAALAPDGAAVDAAGLAHALGTPLGAPLGAHSPGAHPVGSGVVLPKHARALSLTFAATTTGSVAAQRSVSTTVWVAAADGELAPITFAAAPVPVGLTPDAVTTNAVALPSDLGALRIVAVDAVLNGGMPGDGYTWSLRTAVVPGSGVHTDLDLGQATGWSVASDAFSTPHSVRARKSGIGFSAAILDATAGAGIRLMPGQAHRPAVAITTGLASAAGLSVGDSVLFDASWWSTDATVAIITPVIPGEHGDAALFNLAAFHDALLRTVAAPPGANEVWISASQPERALSAVTATAGPNASVTVPDTAFVDRFFGSATLGLWLGCLGCVVLAVIALAAAAGALSRRRRPEVSVFRALGFSLGNQRRSRSGELWAVVGIAAAIGIAAGALVTVLVAATLTRLTVATAPAALPVQTTTDPLTLSVGLAVLALAVVAVVLAYGAAIGRQAADTEYREETQ